MSSKAFAVMSLVGVTGWALVLSCRSLDLRADTPAGQTRAAAWTGEEDDSDKIWICDRTDAGGLDSGTIEVDCAGFDGGSYFCFTPGAMVTVRSHCGKTLELSYTTDSGHPSPFDGGSGKHAMQKGNSMKQIQNIEGLSFTVTITVPDGGQPEGGLIGGRVDPATGTIDVATSRPKPPEGPDGK